MTYPHIFFATSKTLFIGRPLYLRDSRETEMRNYTKQRELALMSKWEKISYLNAGYPRAFIYSVPNAFDNISSH